MKIFKAQKRIKYRIRNPTKKLHSSNWLLGEIFFSRIDLYSPLSVFFLKMGLWSLTAQFWKKIFLLKIARTNAVFYAGYEYAIHFCSETQIFSLNHRRKLRGARKYKRKYEIFAFVGKSWMSQPSFFLDVFTSKDAVFYGLSSDAVRVLGAPHFCVKNSKYMKKSPHFLRKIFLSTLFFHERPLFRGSQYGNR